MEIGAMLPRIDGQQKVTGQARYAAEVSPKGIVHAVMVQSTVAAGEVAALDIARASGMPGVLAILTSQNAAKLHLEKATQNSANQSLLQTTNISFNGETVAVVVAATFEQASAAAAAVGVRYRQSEATPLMRDALAHSYPPKNFRNGETPADMTTGDPDAAFANAPVRIDVTYTTPVEHHNPMEPHATVAEWQGDRLTVWTATQGISGTRNTLAAMFGVPAGDVTVICPYVGGGFGSKGATWPPAVLAAMAARSVGRPVKLVVTRQQMFTSNGYRPATIQHLRLGAGRDGRLVALRHDGLTQMSMPDLGEFAEPVALPTRTLYACPNIATTHRLVPVNQSLPTYMRAPGEAAGVFALESAMDELAVALKMDPVELRLANYAERDASDGRPYASKGLRECYRRGAEAFGWQRRTPEPRSMRDGRLLVGLGMATSTYPTNRRGAGAVVRLMPDGRAWVGVGTQDLGTGTYTIIAQVASDALGLPVHRITVALGDSRLPDAPTSGGSATAASVLPAVQEAAGAAGSKLLSLAREGHEGSWPGDGAVRLRQDGMLDTPNGKLRLADLLARRNLPWIEAAARAELPGDLKDYSRHAFGAQFAEVAVDPDFGTVRVRNWVGAFDVGRLVNAQTGRSQLIGGIVYGIGMALLEETRVDRDSGRILNANIADYLVPVNADVPAIEAIAVEAPDMVTTSLGLKGIGELPMVGVAPAIANAVYHATGVRVRDLPIRLDALLA